MGGCFLFNRPKIEIIDEISKGEKYDYLRPEGTITYSVDRANCIPLIEINFDLKLVGLKWEDITNSKLYVTLTI